MLQQMAVNNTNAVLTLLAGINRVQRQSRYPEKGLVFGNGHWRAFYHCHDDISMHENEHGHFHLFTKTGIHCWSHVAGLSIDRDGQALQWFTVNRWVTDGPWLETEKFPEQLKYITQYNVQDDSVAGWLGILVQLFRDELYDLLAEREKQVEHYSKEQSREQTLRDRQIYSLSSHTIDISHVLKTNLLDKHIPLADTASDLV